MVDRLNKSVIWDLFDLYEPDVKYAICKICQSKLSRGGIGKMASTTPLFNHIKKKHGAEYIQLIPKGSITTGVGDPIINLPHNHVPDMHAVALARLRSFMVGDGEIPDENPAEDSQDLSPVPEQRYFTRGTVNHQDYENTDLIDPSHIPPLLKLPKTTPSPPEPPTLEAEMCLRWNSHYANMQSVFPMLMANEAYIDVTLVAEEKLIKCHKLILSSCSAYFDLILKNTNATQQTIIFMRGMEYWQVKALVDFMYKGEVSVDQSKLESLLKAAEELQIKGLAGNTTKSEPPETVVPPPKLSPKVILQEDEPFNPDSSPMEDDKDDEDYYPNPEYRRKYQGKKARKRRISTAPDPSELKHVKINLKGTKSRPVIKQPKYYDPDYPEYDPDRCIGSPKLEPEPIFDVDNIKLEPIDIDCPDYQLLENPEEKLTPVPSTSKIPDSTITNKIVVKCKDGGGMLIKKIMNSTAPPNPERPQIRVRQFSTTDSIFKNLAPTQMTSILKKPEHSTMTAFKVKKPQSILRPLTVPIEKIVPTLSEMSQKDPGDERIDVVGPRIKINTPEIDLGNSGIEIEATGTKGEGTPIINDTDKEKT